jgi:hypothetical protein
MLAVIDTVQNALPLLPPGSGPPRWSGISAAARTVDYGAGEALAVGLMNCASGRLLAILSP